MRWLFLLGFTPIMAHACSCVGSLVPQSACQLVWQYDAVFSGTVTEIIDPGMPIVRPGEPPPPPHHFPRRSIRLKITRAFTGIDAGTSEVTIETGRGGGDCGYPFERGVEYLVYASRGRARALSTSICSRTRRISDAAQDLKYLRTLPDLPVPGEIRITAVDLHHTDQPRGISGAKVAIEAQNLRRTAVTDSSGRAVFTALQPGEYRVSIALDGYSPSVPVPPVELHAKGCADIAVPLQLDRLITGTVTTSDGRPAAGVAIEAVPRRPRYENELPFAKDTATTDANGRFELRNLQTGDYYLGTSLGHPPTKENPYTRWFYPGTEDPASAVLVHIYDKPEKQTFDLTLPEAQKARVIEGIVVWPDGQPAPGAQIMLEDPRWPWLVPSLAGTTGDAGRFKIEGLNGTTYRVHAVRHSQTTRSADPVIVEPGSNAAKVRLVLSRPGHRLEVKSKQLEDWQQGRGLR